MTSQPGAGAGDPVLLHPHWMTLEVLFARALRFTLLT